jgi:hypothetical protein
MFEEREYHALTLFTPIGAVRIVYDAMGVDLFWETAAIDKGAERLQVDGTFPRLLSLA